MVVATSAAEPHRRRLTAAEFEQMAAAGILHEDDHVELLDGELYQMAAMNGPHIACVARLNHAFVRAVGDRAIVIVQSSMRLSAMSEPEPDIVIARFREDFYHSGPPTPADIFLIIEVADTSLRHDRQVKLPLYAAAGVPETWIAGLPRRQVVAHREPGPEGYRQAVPLTRRGTLAPLALPDIQLGWEDFFGRP